MDHYAPDPLDWRASPLLADSLAGVAPAVVITAEYDPLRDQGVAYAERLRAEGVPVEHANYDGMVHAFFQLGPLVDAAAQAVSQIAAAAKAAFNPAARARRRCEPRWVDRGFAATRSRWC